jgi:hypothetical protein
MLQKPVALFAGLHTDKLTAIPRTRNVESFW